MAKLTKKKMEEYAKAYLKNTTNISATCKALGISRQTWYNYIDDNPSFGVMLSDAEESLLDLSESKLFQHINEGDKTCLIFYLKTKGKNRGYIEGHNINATVTKKTNIDLSKLSNEELDEYEALLNKIEVKE